MGRLRGVDGRVIYNASAIDVVLTWFRTNIPTLAETWPTQVIRVTNPFESDLVVEHQPSSWLCNPGSFLQSRQYFIAELSHVCLFHHLGGNFQNVFGFRMELIPSLLVVRYLDPRPCNGLRGVVHDSARMPMHALRSKELGHVSAYGNNFCHGGWRPALIPSVATRTSPHTGRMAFERRHSLSWRLWPSPSDSRIPAAGTEIL